MLNSASAGPGCIAYRRIKLSSDMNSVSITFQEQTSGTGLLSTGEKIRKTKHAYEPFLALAIHVHGMHKFRSFSSVSFEKVGSAIS